MAILRFDRRWALAATAFGAASFVLMPNWVIHWFGQAKPYGGFVPLLVMPGPLLLLALAKWRPEPARWLLLLRVMPQRVGYDQLMLRVISRTAAQTLVLTVSSGLMWVPTLIWGRVATKAWHVPLQVALLHFLALICTLLPGEWERQVITWGRLAPPILGPVQAVIHITTVLGLC